MKFLVIWELSIVQAETIRAVMRMPEYAKGLREKGKLDARYHIVGKHGGAWVYNVSSNEELEQLIAGAPVYNFARYDLYPLADMQAPGEVLQQPAMA